MKYVPVIGLEVHLQSKTNSKMFCSCPTDYFGKEPNTLTCPTCLGLPGAMPTINKSALDQCMKLSLALHCKINSFTKFDRKNYFYPDLPKGYQISQYDLPIGYEGYLEIDVEGDSRRIRIVRVHQEEDTGKSMHENGETLLDFNKSGVPLIEIVSAPDFTDIDEVIEYAKELKRIVEYLQISDADMEKGQMRFELNISMKEVGQTALPEYKVEVKNIGSISVLEKVIRFEMKRQAKLLDNGETPKQETRGLKDMGGETLSQRSKEGSSDYRYFPEPDLPPVEIDEDWIESVSEQIIELPRDKRWRFVKQYGLEQDVARILTDDLSLSAWYEQSVAAGVKIMKSAEKKYIAREIAKWLIGDVTALSKKHGKPIVDIQTSFLAELTKLLADDRISGTNAKKILEAFFATETYWPNASPSKIMSDQDLEQAGDSADLDAVIDGVISQNEKVADQVRKGKDAAIQFLVGQVMKETRGKANPKIAEGLLRKKLSSGDDN